MLHRVSDFDGFLGTTRAPENGHEIWNLKCLESRAVSFETVARKLVNYKLEFVTLQDIRWDKGDNEPADIFLWKGKYMSCSPASSVIFVDVAIVQIVTSLQRRRDKYVGETVDLEQPTVHSGTQLQCITV
jgi:hypothetical protein